MKVQDVYLEGPYLRPPFDVRIMTTLCGGADFCKGRKEGRNEENEVGR